jgi:hypothetical protein
MEDWLRSIPADHSPVAKRSLKPSMKNRPAKNSLVPADHRNGFLFLKLVHHAGKHGLTRASRQDDGFDVMVEQDKRYGVDAV